ncbi:MAG: hypothetical protein IT307_19975, partial [Chloroflexi bacterium]|nr:hypothetical protein [Chloroflexota bacterium]
ERGQMFARGDEEWQRWKAEPLDGLREEFERQVRSEDLGQRLFGEEASSQKLGIHPMSVYWLLKEMREQEGLVSPPLLRQALEDYASVSILRLLGYRWPEQDEYEQEHGPILDPDLNQSQGEIHMVVRAVSAGFTVALV